MQLHGEDTGDYFKTVCKCEKKPGMTGLPKIRYIGKRSYGSPAIKVFCPSCEETKFYKLTQLQEWEGLPYDPG